MSNRIASATGLATYSGDVLLDAWYPEPALGAKPAAVTGLERGIDTDSLRGVRVEVIHTTSNLDEAPENAADAYLRLHLLSHRLVAPRSLNLDGLFGLLTNVAWTSLGQSPLKTSLRWQLTRELKVST
jgi:2,3,4,5-tetrahydropyridine-2-carboxylate N-succinyltransferase